MPKKSSWNLGLIQAEALKYKTRMEFQKGSRSAYMNARNLHILDTVCFHMEGREQWTEEKIQKIALLYTTRNDFVANSPAAYHAAYQRDILDSVCKHMVVKRRNWTEKEVHQITIQYKTKLDLIRANQKAYRAARDLGITDIVFSHMVHPKKIKSLTLEQLMEKTAVYKSQKEFRKKAKNLYYQARENGWLKKVCAHMDGRNRWTEEEIRAEALKYSTRTEFLRGSPAYQAAHLKGIVNEVCAHMVKKKKDPKEKTESIREEAKKYTTRRDFRLGSPNEYRQASRAKILSNVCNHMPKTKKNGKS